MRKLGLGRTYKARTGNVHLDHQRRVMVLMLRTVLYTVYPMRCPIPVNNPHCFGHLWPTAFPYCHHVCEVHVCVFSPTAGAEPERSLRSSRAEPASAGPVKGCPGQRTECPGGLCAAGRVGSCQVSSALGLPCQSSTRAHMLGMCKHGKAVASQQDQGS